MTFCLAMKVADGLVAIADTRITSGAEAITARKITIHQYGHHSMFVMTSGLRSLRDKALTYFEEVIEESDTSFDKLYKAVNAFAEQVRRVADEDVRSLAASATDVYFPIDVVVYPRDSYQMHEYRFYQMHEYRFERAELADVSQWWNSNLRRLIDEAPSSWVDAAFPQIARAPVTPIRPTRDA